MGDVIALFGAGSATALATGVGAIPVFFLGERAETWRPVLWGLAIGLMGVASVVGLLAPALNEGSLAAVGGGLAAGVAFLLLTRRGLRSPGLHLGALRGAGVRTSILVFGVLFVHSLPEGMAIGSAWASNTAGLSLYIVLAIGLQNVPEGTSVAIPMAASGFSRKQQFWGAVLTSAPQPVGALIAYGFVEQVQAVLPVSFAFAAGAMLALVAVELVPAAFTRAIWPLALAGTVAGGLVMGALAVVLGV
jgi:zinc transporter, ZIP family